MRANVWNINSRYSSLGSNLAREGFFAIGSNLAILSIKSCTDIRTIKALANHRQVLSSCGVASAARHVEDDRDCLSLVAGLVVRGAMQDLLIYLHGISCFPEHLDVVIF